LPFPFHRFHVPTRRLAEHTSVLAAKLRGTFVPDLEGSHRSVKPIPEHQSPSFLESQSLLVLERTQTRHPFEVEVEGRWAHSNVLGQRLDP
jgi:hypothetical protein